MKAYGWTEAELWMAASRMSDIVANDFAPERIAYGSKGTQLQFVVRPTLSASRSDTTGLYPPCIKVGKSYQGKERGISAPCWHGFGHFFRAMFDIHPDGRIVTAMATYKGREDFIYQTADLSGGGVLKVEECHCAEYGLENFLLGW